jgi:hypothetical protein
MNQEHIPTPQERDVLRPLTFPKGLPYAPRTPVLVVCAHRDSGEQRRLGSNMAIVMRMPPARAPLADHEQRQVAVGYLHEAWAEARLDGIDGDCMAQACLFAALSELVTTYGEDATAKFATGLSERIANGEFSLEFARQ